MIQLIESIFSGKVKFRSSSNSNNKTTNNFYTINIYTDNKSSKIFSKSKLKKLK